MKNITLSMPEKLLQEGRAFAASQGISLNELVRVLLRKTINRDGRSSIDELLTMSDKIKIETKGKSWSREDLYDREIFS